MTENDREITWERYDRDESDFPRPHRGYFDEGTGCYDADPEPEPASNEAEEAE